MQLHLEVLGHSLVRNLPNLVPTTTVEGQPYVTYDFDMKFKILECPPLIGCPSTGHEPAD